MIKDERNFLIYRVIDFIKLKKPKFVLIENVPAFLKLLLPHDWKLSNVENILKSVFENDYIIESYILDSADYWVPQFRKRAIVKLYQKWLKWWVPKKEKHISVEKAIWHLPSLEAWENSDILWHFARKHTKEHISWMKHTPTWETAFTNKDHFPKKQDGTRVKWYNSSYRRILWNKPAPTITMRNDAISSQRNVHPWRLLPNWVYSDARVLTPRELMILNSLPDDWKIPKDTPEILIRQCIGESMPPLMLKKIINLIWKEDEKN